MPKRYFRKGANCEGEGNFSSAQKNLKARKNQVTHQSRNVITLSRGNEKKREEERGREAGKKGDEEAVLFLQSSLGGNGESQPGWGWHSPGFWRREFRCWELIVLLHSGVHPDKKLFQAEVRLQRPAPSLSWTKQVTTDMTLSLSCEKFPSSSMYPQPQMHREARLSS